MARYYNKTRGPVAIALQDGRPTVVAPKKWVTLENGDDTTASVVAAVRRGDLIRSDRPAPDKSESGASKPDAVQNLDPTAKAVVSKPSAIPDPAEAPPAKADVEPRLPTETRRVGTTKRES